MAEVSEQSSGQNPGNPGPGSPGDPGTTRPGRGMSRRTVMSAGATLLAGFGLGAAPPGLSAGSAWAAPGAAPAGDPAGTPADLALFRPVAVSSTDYAPTPAGFAVDGLAEVGARGSGWRAAQGDPQWIVVDLQAPCRITSV